MADAKVNATIAPTPGVVISRRVGAWPRASAERRFSMALNSCSSPARALYDPNDAGRWCCRRCARVDYAVRHEERDAVERAVALRRRLGAPLALGSPLGPRPAGRA